jgi:S-formylglutathione hydrolase
MTFAVFVPPQAIEKPCPVLWYLSGLTCTHANVMEKGEYRRMAAELGLIIVCPDTSPRGNDVPDELTNWQMGKGAGFYLDATEAPWAENYQMYTYITEELPAYVSQHFRIDMDRQGIFGHSMGGHGAMTIALKNPDRFKSCSAFAPIVEPSTADWSAPALEKYLGADRAAWRQVRCLRSGKRRRTLPGIPDRSGQGRQLPGQRPAALAVRGGGQRYRHQADAAHARALRPLLLLHLDLHGRSPEVARRAARLIASIG